jgi:type II secretory pathway component GspD/PulD (secretin)
MREKHEMLRLLKELGQDMPEFQDHADAAAKELDKLIDSAATTRAEKARQATETHLIARIRHEVARAERAARERDEALSREASLCDLLNTWARESNVEEAERQEEAKAVADRLWAHVSDKANVLRRERDELRFALEYLAESGMTAQNMKKYARLAALDSGSERSEGEKRAAFAMGSRSPRQVGGPDQPRARNSADQLPANSGPGGAAAAAATPSGEAGQDAPGAAASTEGSD